MSSRKYPRATQDSTDKEPVVREAKARAYAREKDKKSIARLVLGIAAVKRCLKKPVKRSKREIAWALDIVGIGEGPADLSEKTREYLYSDR
jgi:hypothetical protein